MDRAAQRAAVAGMFDRAAETYDRVGVELFGPVAQLLVDALAPRPGERVLDVGCGRGAVLLRAFPHVGPAGSVTGLDLSPGMVEAATADAEAAGVPAEFLLGDAQELDLPEGAYDVVAASLVLFFLPDPVAALRAWGRLLAPGGRVGVTTFGPVDERWRAVDAAVMAHAPAGMLDPRLAGPGSPFASDAGVERLFADAGLSGVRTVSGVVPVRYDDEEQWYRHSWSLGQRRVWESLAKDEREKVRGEAYGLLKACRKPDGRIGFDQHVRVTTAGPPAGRAAATAR